MEKLGDPNTEYQSTRPFRLARCRLLLDVQIGRDVDTEGETLLDEKIIYLKEAS